MFKAAIIGASGYTGGELLRMLSNHPEVEVTEITSRQYDGTPAHKIHPHIRDSGLVFTNKSPSDLDADVVFTATPHGASMKIVPELLETGTKVVDLSGDYRYRDTAVYEKWYGMEHTDSENEGVFGLPELYRDEIKKTDLVANPGCFPTGMFPNRRNPVIISSCQKRNCRKNNHRLKIWSQWSGGQCICNYTLPKHCRQPKPI